MVVIVCSCFQNNTVVCFMISSLRAGKESLTAKVQQKFSNYSIYPPQMNDSHTLSTSLAIKFIDNNVSVLRPSSGCLDSLDEDCVSLLSSPTHLSAWRYAKAELWVSTRPHDEGQRAEFKLGCCSEGINSCFYSGQQAANVAVLFTARSTDLDSRWYSGGLFCYGNLTPRRVRLFPPPLLCKSEPSMCRPLHEMGGGVDDLHCRVTHSRGVLKPGSSWSQQSVQGHKVITVIARWWRPFWKL